MILLIAAAIVYCIIVGLILYGRWEHGILEKMGVPIVKHHPLLGSTREIYQKPGGLLDIEWREKYGDIFGVYEGRQAQLFVCVPELVRLICVKDSEYFNSKRQLDFQDPVMNEMPDFQPLKKWKLLRSLATPVFTTAKIKLMNLPIKESTKDFIVDVKAKIKSGNGILEKYPLNTNIHTMLTDLICRCVFSIRISESNDGNNEFAKLVKELVSPVQDLNPSQELLVWSHTFPLLRKLMGATILAKEPVQRFTLIFKEMMSARKKSGQKFNDLVDLSNEWMDKLNTPEFKNAQMTELTIICQALLFFFAAQDQISTMVSSVIYHITQDAEMEGKVYQEIDTVFASHDGKIEHEQLNEFVYLNACINESLRLYSFFHRAERVCTKNWRNEEYGLDIKKGMVIQIPLWAINRHPDYNENPKEFNPERFMPENKNKLNVYSSSSFGHGPRNCIGRLFATETMTLMAAHILKDLKFLQRKDTQLKFIPGGPFFAPHEPIYVDIVERKV